MKKFLVFFFYKKYIKVNGTLSAIEEEKIHDFLSKVWVTKIRAIL